MDTDLVVFENVSLGYARQTVLRQLNFVVEEGDFIGIVGANGSGKTTLLRAMLGLLHPLTGQIRRETTNHARPLFAYVPQRGQLDEHFPFRVREIVLMGRYGQMGLLRRPSQRDRELVIQAMEHLEIIALAEKPFAELSGGQKQRVLLARGLVSEPAILVLDEPTEGLDPALQSSILDLIRHFHQEHRMTVIWVTHHLNDIANHARTIGLLHQGELLWGKRELMLTGPHLSNVFGIPFSVEARAGRAVIFSGGVS